MDLLDKFLNTDTATELTPKYDCKNEQAAWIAILVACANIDGNVTEPEVQIPIQNFENKTIFDGHDLESYYKPALIFSSLYGSKALIDSCTSLISEEAKECLLCQALELISNDGIIQSDEEGIFKYLADSLKIPAGTSGKIIEVYMMRNKWNKVQKQPITDMQIM